MNVHCFSFYPQEDMDFSEDVYRVDITSVYSANPASANKGVALDFMTVKILKKDFNDQNDNEFTFFSDEYVLKSKDIEQHLLMDEDFLYRPGSEDNSFFKPCLINNLWPVGQEDPLKEDVISAFKAGLIAFDTMTKNIVWVSPKHSKVLGTEGVTAFHNHNSSKSQVRMFFESSKEAKIFFQESFNLDDIEIRDFTPEQEMASFLFDCTQESNSVIQVDNQR
jgi:hypothetical protein